MVAVSVQDHSDGRDVFAAGGPQPVLGFCVSPLYFRELCELCRCETLNTELVEKFRATLESAIQDFVGLEIYLQRG